jgi:hypothetical protein
MFTVIEEKSGRRIERLFYCRSVGAAYDVGLSVIFENIERLAFCVDLGTALGKRVLCFRSVSALQSLLI